MRSGNDVTSLHLPMSLANRRGSFLSLRVMASLVLLTSGCASSLTSAPSGTSSSPGPSEVTQPKAAQQLLLIFGGEDHKTYLGCLTAQSQVGGSPDLS